MSTTPPEAPSGPPPPEPGAYGPRVTRDEVRDLGRLRRSSTDRKVAGVAGGIARHLDIDPLLVRVAFVVLTVFGGAGIALYGACWLLVPDEETDDAMVNLDEGIRTVILAVVGALSLLAVVGDSFGDWHFPWPLAIAGLVVAFVLSKRDRRRERRLARHGRHQHPWDPPAGTPSNSAAGVAQGARSYGEQVAAQAKEAALREHAEKHGWTYDPYRPPAPPRPVDPRKRGPILFLFTLGLAALLLGVLGTVDLAGADVPAAAYPATVLATCGAMLLVGAFFGRAGGLILVGLVALVATVATTLAHGHSIGQLSRTPMTAAEVEGSYDLGIGEIVLDLRDVEDLDALAGRTVELEATFGHIEVIVPEQGIDVRAIAQIEGEGHARVFTRDEDGTGTTTATLDGIEGDADALTIDARLHYGEIEIVTEEDR